MNRSTRKKNLSFLALILSVSSLVACGDNSISDYSSLSNPSYNSDTICNGFSFSYDNTSSIKNSLQGNLYISNIKDDIKSIEVCYGSNDDILQGYNLIDKLMVSTKKELDYSFKDHLLIPEECRRVYFIGKDEEGKEIDRASIALDKYKEVKDKREVQIISDQQISGFEAFTRRSLNTFKDIAENAPKSMAIFCNGDIVDEAVQSNYTTFYKTFDDAYINFNKTPDLNVTLGNHEFILHSETNKVDNFTEAERKTRYDDRLKMWKMNSGNQEVYSLREYDGIPFINLGTTAFPRKLDGNSQADAYLGEEQLSWLKDTLSKIGKDKTVFLLSHGSLRDTVSGSLTSLKQTWYGYSKEEEDKLRSIISEYPNILFFSSHSHWSFEEDQPYLLSEDSPSFFNTAAIGYLWQGSGDGRHYSTEGYERDGGQGLYIQLSDDQVFIRGRQFEDRDGKSKYWYSPYQFVLQLYR